MPVENFNIRREFDPKSRTWQFSIVDTLENFANTTDARNYWKVLKNRLKKSDFQLVTKCNQLKMLSSDGKYYLTDTADSETILKIIESLSPSSILPLKLWFERIEASSIKNMEVPHGGEIELSVDIYQTNTQIVVKAMIDGISADNIFISVGYKTLTIKGERKAPESASSNKNYVLQEIYWGAFSRTIALPSEIEVDKVQASEQHGLLTIILPKIDTERVRIIKIKSL